MTPASGWSNKLAQIVSMLFVNATQVGTVKADLLVILTIDKDIKEYYWELNIIAHFLQVYDLQFYDQSCQQNYILLWVRILQPHRSSLIFLIRQLYESRSLQFSTTLDVLDSNMGPYPC
jgi:hypothetical protein